jgi:hypothetical protein
VVAGYQLQQAAGALKADEGALPNADQRRAVVVGARGRAATGEHLARQLGCVAWKCARGDRPYGGRVHATASAHARLRTRARAEPLANTCDEFERLVRELALALPHTEPVAERPKEIVLAARCRISGPHGRQ